MELAKLQAAAKLSLSEGNLDVRAATNSLAPYGPRRPGWQVEEDANSLRVRLGSPRLRCTEGRRKVDG
jgi:hypothetical protein